MTRDKFTGRIKTPIVCYQTTRGRPQLKRFPFYSAKTKVTLTSSEYT